MERIVIDPAAVVVAKDQFSCPLGEDIIVLDVKAGIYFSLDNVGAFVWQRVQKPTTVRDLHQAVLDTFEVGPDVSERDLLALLRELAKRNLIEIRDAAAA